MADESPKSSIASEFSGLPMKALIAAPLKATADASGMVARSQLQFILSTCFEKEGESGQLKPIMIRFTVERQVLKANGEPADENAKMEFTIPLLTLVPLNTIAVNELDVSFEMEVKSSTENFSNNIQTDNKDKSHPNGKKKTDVTGPYYDDEFHCELHGSLAKKTTNREGSSRSGNARYDIKLQAGKAPLPLGLTTIIDAFTKSIAPIQLKEEKPKPISEDE